VGEREDGGSMKEYHKINSLFKRDQKTNKFIMNDWADPAFEYLSGNQWQFTEKVDGTNIRVMWNHETKELKFGGRTDSASMPLFLLYELERIFHKTKFIELYPEVSMCLYGEGYGAKIQKGGGNYISGGQSFVLFDVLIGDMYLERPNIEDVGGKLGLKIVPIIGNGTLEEAIERCKFGFNSQWGNFEAEGIVARPLTELKDRRGHRIITKVKCRDFK
jgi:hypothetical protein